MSFKVYITDYDYPDNSVEQKILEPVGIEVIGLQCKDGKNLETVAKDADALMVQYAKITRATIEAMPNLKVIARYGVGVDIVDVKAATERGIVCTNVMNYCNDEVADHNISLLLMLLRRIPMYVEQTKEGKWHWSETGLPVHRFNVTTIGVIGLGRIAQNMTKKLQALGFRVIANDPYLTEEKAKNLGVTLVDVETLCKKSDAIVLQCPYTADTHHIIGKEQFSVMKHNAVLVNCSRGKLVDDGALYDALSNHQIASAAMDDIEDEPAKRFDWKPSENPLFSLPNCFITPHVAYYSEESLLDARTKAAMNVKSVLMGKGPLTPVYPK